MDMTAELEKTKQSLANSEAKVNAVILSIGLIVKERKLNLYSTKSKMSQDPH